MAMVACYLGSYTNFKLRLIIKTPRPSCLRGEHGLLRLGDQHRGLAAGRGDGDAQLAPILAIDQRDQVGRQAHALAGGPASALKLALVEVGDRLSGLAGGVDDRPAKAALVL